MTVDKLGTDPQFNNRRGGRAAGMLYGLSAVVMWAAYLSFTRAGIADGLAPQDIVFMRFGTAALVLLPWLVMNRPAALGGVGWARGVALTLAVGPPFVFAASGGFIFAPLSHGAVLQPSTAALSSMLIAFVILREPLCASRTIGAVIIIAGIVLIASGMSGRAGPNAWIGDLLFVLAGLCWATFTILIRAWSIGGLPATAAASVLSGAVVIPAQFLFGTMERILALPPAILFGQVVIQGVLAGVVAIVAYGRAVKHLGASGAALFPALVPATTLLIGIPVTGVWPTPVEWMGALMATFGLTVAMRAMSQPR